MDAGQVSDREFDAASRHDAQLRGAPVTDSSVRIWTASAGATDTAPKGPGTNEEGPVVRSQAEAKKSAAHRPARHFAIWSIMTPLPARLPAATTRSGPSCRRSRRLRPIPEDSLGLLQMGALVADEVLELNGKPLVPVRLSFTSPLRVTANGALLSGRHGF